jgi:hypothetical protein
VRLSMWIAMMIAGASLAGCASERVTYLPDGRRGYGVSCGHFYQDWSSCVIRAGRLCREKGYTSSRASVDLQCGGSWSNVQAMRTMLDALSSASATNAARQRADHLWAQYGVELGC